MDYLLFFKLAKNMLSPKYFINLLKSITIIFISFNIPCFVFSNITSLSKIDSINNLSISIYRIFYKIPAFLFLYTYIGHRITKQINILTSKNTANPSHLYVFFLINFSYFVFTFLGQIYKIGIYLFPITEVLTYSLYFSEFVYPYIDNNNYRYNNFVDFYNNNIMFFLIFSGIYTFINISFIPNEFYLLGLYVYTVFMLPFLLAINYNKYSPECIKYYNIFYPFEQVLSFFVSIISLILLDKLTKRNIDI